jgi:hypothetical protein
MEENAIERGILPTGHGDGFFVADITGARREDLIAWISEYAACVDVQRNDVVCLLGRGLDSLVLIRAFDNFTTEVSRRLSNLTPDELLEACQRASWEYQQAQEVTHDGLEAALAKQAEIDLVNSGLLHRGEGTTSLEPPPEPEPVISAEFRDETPREELWRSWNDPFYNADPRRGAGF